MCQTSARFDVIILIIIILTRLGDLKILKEQNSVEKSEFSTGWIDKIL